MFQPLMFRATRRFIPLFLALPLVVSAAGEKYREASGALYQGVMKNFIGKNICADFQDCSTKLQIYSESGDRVRLNMYGQENRRAADIAAIFLIGEGLNLTQGVPITFKVYKQGKEQSLGFGSLFKSPEAVLQLEINQ